MAGPADLVRLRQALEFIPSWISNTTTHARLPRLCEALGLPTPVDAGEASKLERAAGSFAVVSDSELPLVAERALATGELTPAQRNTVQDVLWGLVDCPVVPKRTRREIARAVYLDDVIRDSQRFTRLLDRLWIRAGIPDLPALLPEVWLHWDPKTVQTRGPEALLRFRMDFLLLLPHGRRVVVEVDGQHHYATGDRPDPAVYARTVRSDRELKLNDYDVFRFGAHELRTEQHARDTAEEFFRDLLRTSGVSIPLRTPRCLAKGGR